MVIYGTKNGSSMASLEETFEAPLFLRVYIRETVASCHIFTPVSLSHFFESEYILVYLVTRKSYKIFPPLFLKGK